MRPLNMNGAPPEKEAYRCPGKPHKPTPLMLMNEITKLMGDRIRSSGEQALMQKSSRLLMMELAHRDGRTQLDLVKATHLKAPTVSVTLQKMERDGIIMRKPDEYDLRAMRVYLTEKGREMDRAVIERIHEEETVIMQGVTERETEVLLEILTKMRNNLTGGEDFLEKN